MVDMNIDKLSDWNKYQLQIKQLRQDLESERGELFLEIYIYIYIYNIHHK